MATREEASELEHCEHPLMHFSEGGRFIVCSVCFQNWVALQPGGHEGYDRIGAVMSDEVWKRAAA